VRRPLKLNSGLVVGGLLSLLFVVGAVGVDWFAPVGPDDGDLLDRLQPPSAEHLLGTDTLGRDLFWRLVYGARISLLVGVSSVAAAIVIGAPLGLTAGVLGGRWDALIMRAMDVLLSVPKILVAILIMAVTGAGLGNLVFAIALWNVPVFARIARSNTLSLRERDFVTAAYAVGASRPRVILRHVLPNTFGELIVITSLSIATAIMAESGLSFLGLGAPAHLPSWGQTIAEGRPYLRNAPHVTAFGGLFVMLAVLGFNLLGDGLRDRLDPRSRGATLGEG
jgi:peptide/nickel transport system permease protein